ncbi:MAG: DUF4339 domain-containing protein [Bacteriovorax sp.]|nr:DUF4339 domain-containing protein [Bacteriovorax sp.]
MVNWYYVVGSERIGPVDVETLKKLFLKDEITLDTYVWKKGFQNWERLKEVSELRFDDYDSAGETIKAMVEEIKKTEPAIAKAQAPVKNEEPQSPEINFNFDWRKVKDKDELFFVRIGKDRKNYDGSDIFGPYTLVELKEAMSEKRMNFQTLIFSPGMSSWTKIQDTPLNENYNGVNQTLGIAEVPLILVFNYSPLPLITVVKKAGTKDGVLLGSGPFVEFQNQTIKATLYVGSEMKVKNVRVKIHNYDKKDQSIECQFLDLDQDAKRIMLNHAV